MPFALLPISIPVAEQLLLLEPFNSYEAVAFDSSQPWFHQQKSLAQVHPANLEPDIEQSSIPVDVFGSNTTHLFVPSLNQGMKAVDVVEMIDPVVVLVGRDHLAVAFKNRDQFVVWRAIVLNRLGGSPLDYSVILKDVVSGLYPALANLR